MNILRRPISETLIEHYIKMSTSCYSSSNISDEQKVHHCYADLSRRLDTRPKTQYITFCR